MTALQLKIMPNNGEFAVFWGTLKRFGPADHAECLAYLDQNKPTPQAKSRRCMNCRQYFMSEHAGNRRCEQCKQLDHSVFDGVV